MKKIRRLNFVVFVYLGLPNDFLSVIFGFPAKFHVDILGKTILEILFLIVKKGKTLGVTILVATIFPMGS